MCGTASVSEALRICGYRVLASDIMTFAVHHARVRLLLAEAPRFSALGIGSYGEIHKYLSELRPIEGLFFKEYSELGQPENGTGPRSYFSGHNAGRIDAMTEEINTWVSADLVSQLEESLLRHDLVLAANRVANIAGTYGHHRAKLSGAATRPLELRPAEWWRDAGTQHEVLQGPAEAIADRVRADLCYLDPPYMKRQYAANYHIIETIARGDNPEAVGVSGLRPWRDQYSDFCSRVKVQDAFRKILRNARCGQFLVSYSEDGLLELEELVSLFSEFGSVTVYRIPFARFKSNSGGAGGVVTEYLFHVGLG